VAGWALHLVADDGRTLMVGYSGTPLAAKLGIAAGHRLLLDGAPPELRIDGLPAQLTIHSRVGTGPYDVIVCFCADSARLHRRWSVLHQRTTSAGALWIAWPKRSSGLPTDLDENVVRDFALAHGRVDVKVCAIDSVWSGLKHVVRMSDR
jgi:hypothetical protein